MKFKIFSAVGSVGRDYTEEEIISSDLDLAISMIKAAHSHAIKADASGLPDLRA